MVFWENENFLTSNLLFLLHQREVVPSSYFTFPNFEKNITINIFKTIQYLRDGCEVLIELVFCIRCCGHCRGINADKGDWVGNGVESTIGSRSEPLLPGSIMLSRLFLTVNPTPYSLSSPESFPCQ